MALEKGIHIHIHLPQDKGIPVVAKPEKKAPSKEYDGLLLRLSNQDALDEEETMKLTADVVTFVKMKLDKGEKGIVKEFLSEAKHKLSPDMKDLISEDFKLRDL